MDASDLGPRSELMSSTLARTASPFATSQPASPARSQDGQAMHPVQALAARHFFVIGAGLALAVALLLALLPSAVPVARRPALAGLLLAYSGVLLLAARVHGARQPWAVALASLLGIVVIAATVALSGWGPRAPGLALAAVLVFMTAAVAPPRLGIGVTLAAVAAIAALGIADSRGLLPERPALGPSTPWLWFATLVLAILGGLAAGRVGAAMALRQVAAADERQRRFSGLLAIAADAYWEIDAEYRLVTLTRPARGDRPAASADDELLGALPWTLPQLHIDPEALDMLQADLDARAQFRDIAVQWVTEEGLSLHYAVSGEPRLSSQGAFLGYWGVARDITADVSARGALAATESRYRDLFEHIPTPLLLHRNGRVLDANPAALSLFGIEEPAAGTDLLSFFENGDSRERARRRADQLDALPIGQALPVTDFRLRSRSGRRITVRATGVRVQAEGGLATLSIFLDDTERRTAEDAVRRSETMLSQLFATSPDAVTLSDFGSGRYAMVNRMFEQLTGWSGAEVAGRTSAELGLWAKPEQRTQFTALIQRDGRAQDFGIDFRTKSGATVSVLASGARFMMDRRDYLVVSARDVTATERQRLERAAILDTASIGIAFTRERRFVLANPCFERMFGWPEGSLAGQAGRVVWSSDAEYAAIGARVGPALARGEVVSFEHEGRRRDGAPFKAKMTANAIDPRRPTEGGTVWIVEDVTRQREAEEQLARARDAAEAANRAKSAFLANTSHELRTPLNAIIGLSQLARDAKLDETRRREFLDQIGDSAQALSAIINDILDLSKIESGKLLLEAAPFDLGALLRALHLGHAMLADAHGLVMRLEAGPGSEAIVRGDALRVRQIVGNYLGNALQFTTRGEICLGVRRLDERRMRFEVRDTGPGIDEATQARLFEPFTQADESTTRRFGGTGLGLSICRELAMAMGGSVGMRSTPGEGSLFWAELPLPAVAADELPPPAPAPSDHSGLRGMRVLLVEDNPVNLLIASAMLEQWGVAVATAGDGAQALDAVTRAVSAGTPFAAVLMDVQMPQMSGYEATARLRERFSPQALPIVALTAAALVTEREAALAAGMNDFLTKPIDADKLRSTLLRWAPRGSS